uniref:Uncharacterized protein n=1 Tax=Anguilla anguilla TaxID=7936 RepID=A0A0E9SQU6_ANGAN
MFIMLSCSIDLAVCGLIYKTVPQTRVWSSNGLFLCEKRTFHVARNRNSVIINYFLSFVITLFAGKTSSFQIVALVPNKKSAPPVSSL